jgi:hypothetical protein
LAPIVGLDRARPARGDPSRWPDSGHRLSGGDRFDTDQPIRIRAVDRLSLPGTPCGG